MSGVCVGHWHTSVRRSGYRIASALLGGLAAYAGYLNPNVMRADAAASLESVPLLAFLLLGFLLATVQAFDLGDPAASWSLAAAPFLGDSLGVYAGTLVAGHVVPSVLMLGLAGTVVASALGLALVALEDTFGSGESSVDLVRLFVDYCFRSAGAGVAFLIVSGSLTVVLG